MKYEKFEKEGQPWIRIHVPPHDIVERPMVDADEELFKESDSVEAPSGEPVPAGDEPPADDPEPEPVARKRRR